MTKLEVLRIFARTGRFMKPDDVWRQLGSRLDRRSLYSYLDRLRKQGLLQRGPKPPPRAACLLPDSAGPGPPCVPPENSGFFPLNSVRIRYWSETVLLVVKGNRLLVSDLFCAEEPKNVVYA